MRKRTIISGGMAIVLALSGCAPRFAQSPASVPLPRDSHQIADSPIEKVLANLIQQTRQTTSYDPAYVSLPYPNGDVPRDRGVCTDVVIRALRAAGVDLQKAVHEDMLAHFAAYPHQWHLRHPDSNIDHRRVPNLQTFFRRKHKSLLISSSAADYRPGDIVSWKLPQGLDHIGVVSDLPASTATRYLIIHNIGHGAQAEDVLFAWRITGHYRYFSDAPKRLP